jgi:hypothetical protein
MLILDPYERAQASIVATTRRPLLVTPAYQTII